MEKLQLKHLAGYLPYELKIRCFRNEQILFVEDLFLNGEVLDYLLITSKYNHYKPILHPLSDLIKLITINGITFVPDTWIYYNIKKDVEIYQFLNGEISLDIITENYSQTINLIDGYLIMQKLLEWHFDIYGLIDKGLAIDINTLKSCEL